MTVKTPFQIISRKYSIHGYPFEIRLVWGNAICFSILHRNEHLLKLIVFSYLKNFNDRTKHRYINQENYKFVTGECWWKISGVDDKIIPLKLCTIEIKFRQDNWIDMNQVQKDQGTTKTPARFRTDRFWAESLDPWKRQFQWSNLHFETTWFSINAQDLSRRWFCFFGW